LSSKSTLASGSRALEEFNYPPAPAAPPLEGGEPSAPILFRTVKVEPKPAAPPEQDTSAQREQQAWSKGVEAGRAEARAASEQQVTKLREEFLKSLKDFSAEREVYFQRVEEQVVRLTLSIARKILHREAQVDPLLLSGILRVALEKIGANTNTRLRANPADIRIWTEYFVHANEEFPTPELIGDPEIPPGRCILETELGTTEIGLDTQLQEIELGFLDLLAQRPASK
jgi:flagellar assembly protein FliH